jgi:dehydrogenase/reductase SDR family protein 12
MIKNADPNELNVNLQGKSFMVTGANQGLGYITAKQLAERGGRVHLICRNKEKGEEALDKIKKETNNNEVFLHVVDVSSTKQIHEFADRFQKEQKSLDVLINNASIMPSKRTLTDEGFESTFATNTLSTFLLTNLLIPVLSKSNNNPRVIAISSGGMLIEPLDTTDIALEKLDPFDGVAAYSRTKRQQVALTEKFADVYKDTPVSFYSMHPGWSDTPGFATQLPGFYKTWKNMIRTTEQGVDTILWLALSDKVGKKQSGEFFRDRAVEKKHLPLARTSYTKDKVDTLWNKLCELTKWHFDKPSL